MDLNVEEVAAIFNLSKPAVDQLVSDKKIPHYTLQNQIRFSREEIESWMLNHTQLLDTLRNNREISTEGWQQYSLYRAIHKGDVILDKHANSKDQVIVHGAQLLADGLGMDQTIMKDMLLEREALQPTALNRGIAVPHTRDFLLGGSNDIVLVSLPSDPVEWGALDGNPVHAAFFLFACNDKHHLNLLAKIAQFASDPEAVDFLKSSPSKMQLLEYVKQFEKQLHLQKTSSAV